MAKSCIIKTLRFLVICLLAETLHAQNPDIVRGYYISTQGDSVVGQIRISNTKGNTLRFKADGKRWESIPATAIKEIRGDQGLYFIPREIRSEETSELVLVQKIVGGAYNLYEGQSPKAGKVFYLQGFDSENFIRLNKLGYEPQLKTVIGACALRADTRRIAYSRNALTRYVETINRCKKPDIQPFAYHDPKPLKFRLGLGFNTFYYSFKPNFADGDYFDQKYLPIRRFSGGLSLRLNLVPMFTIHAGVNFINKRMVSDTIATELKYYKLNSSGNLIPTSDYYKFKLDLDFKYLEFPVGVLYTILPHKKWSPIIDFALIFRRMLVADAANDFGYPICRPSHPCNPDPQSAHLYTTNVNNIRLLNALNFMGGIGIRHLLTARQEFEIKASFIRQAEIVDLTGYNPREGAFELSMNERRIQVGFSYHYFFK